MAGDGLVVEDFGDGLGGECGLFDGFDDEAGKGFLAERDEDECAGSELLVGLVGQNIRSGAEDFGGGDLVVVHDIIIYERRQR